MNEDSGSFLDENSNGTATQTQQTSTPNSTVSARSTGKAQRKRRQHFDDETLIELKQKTFAEMKTAVSGIENVSAQIAKKDKFDLFGERIASALRFIPDEFAERAIAQITVELAKIELEAVNFSKV